jgi:hypothetical protein
MTSRMLFLVAFAVCVLAGSALSSVAGPGYDDIRRQIIEGNVRGGASFAYPESAGERGGAVSSRSLPVSTNYSQTYLYFQIPASVYCLGTRWSVTLDGVRIIVKNTSRSMLKLRWTPEGRHLTSRKLTDVAGIMLIGKGHEMAYRVANPDLKHRAGTISGFFAVSAVDDAVAGTLRVYPPRHAERYEMRVVYYYSVRRDAREWASRSGDFAVLNSDMERCDPVLPMTVDTLDSGSSALLEMEVWRR